MSKIYDKTTAALKATTIDAKILDAQKIMVWDGSSNISKRINLLDVIKEDGLKHYHEQVSATNATAQGECSGFKIATENVPHEWRIEKIEIPVLNTVTVEHYIGAYIVTGNTKEAILSDNATAWTTGTIATWTFKNNPIKVPTGSSLELYIITSADGLGQTEGTRSGHKIKTYYNSNGTGFMRYDGLPYGNRDVLCTFSCGDVNLDELNTTIKELSSKVEELDDEKIDTLISDLSTYNRYETNYFSTNIEGTNGSVSSFRFGFKHFPHGLVKRISLYGRDAITSNIPEAHTTGCYLMANIYKEDGTLVSSTSSTNKLVAQFRPDSSTIVLNTWEFDNLITPKEDEVIKFIPSPDGVTQVANYNLGLLVDSYHTHEDCMCGGDGDFVNNPLASGSRWLAIAIIEGDFIHDNENQNHFTDSTKHLKSVERSVIDSLYTPTNVLAWDNNFNNETLGVASMKGFIISRPYITNGKFVEVRWTSQGTATNAAVHMKITLRDTNGAPIKSYVSNNTENFSVAGLKSYRFNEEWEVDNSISSISFEPCNEDGTIRTDVQIRTRVIGNAADNDSDGSESTNANYKINVQFYKIGSVTNKFTSHVGDNTHLTETDRNLLSDLANNTGSKSYDWTPDIDLRIQFSLTNNYTIPVNGWLVVNSNTTDDTEMWSLTVNDKQSFNSDSRGNLPIQILLSKNDVISTDSTANRSCYFLPCKSEELDYRITKTPYDVWANAVIEDENGNLSVQNLHVPDASSWYTETPQEVKNSIIRVEDEVAYDVNNNLVCNIQSSEIVNGSNMFYYCISLASYSGDLSNLVNGSGMFYDSSLASFSSDLSSLEDGYNMFYNTSLASFSGDLSNLVNGQGMFYNTGLESFSGDLSNLVYGGKMFSWTPLESFSSDLSSLVDGYGMFANTALTSFSSDLSSLVDGQQMFLFTPLESFSSDLSNLANGKVMFYGTPLTSFSSDLSSLICGYFMFAYTSQLESFSGDLSSLVNGIGMFASSESLTSFSGDLSNLVNGGNMFGGTPLESFSGDLNNLLSGHSMFSGTYLNEQSIQTIANTIQDISELDKNDDSIWRFPNTMIVHEDGGYSLQYMNIDQSDRGRLDLSYDESITDLTNINNSIAQIKAKGWTVYLDGTQM